MYIDAASFCVNADTKLGRLNLLMAIPFFLSPSSNYMFYSGVFMEMVGFSSKLSQCSSMQELVCN